MKTLFILILLFVISGFALAQSVGIGTTDPDTSAALDIVSTTQGVLVPRMTSAQRTAINNAATGLLVFDMTTHSFWFKGNALWTELVDSSNTVVQRNGLNLFMALGGFVGVGTNIPSSKLEVKTPLASEGIVHSDGNVRLATSTAADGAHISTTSNHPLHLSANGSVNGILITPIGAVGIGGVIAPIAALDVKADAGTPGIRLSDGNVTVGTSTAADGAHISTSSNHPLHLSANGSANGILITPIGAVGIGGVIAPVAALDVKADVGTSGIRLSDGNVTMDAKTSADAGIIETVSNHALHLNANGGANHLVITPVGAVGVGIVNPTAQLEVRTPADVLGFKHSDGVVSMATKVGSGIGKLATTSNHPLHLSANNLPNQLTLATNGNVGIGTATPHGALQFSNSLANRKAVLYETVDNDHEYYGFGINSSTLRYQVDGPTANHVFYSAASPTFSKELMRIAGNGNVGVNVSTPANRMDIHSGATGRTGTHATNRPLYVTGDMMADNNGIEFRHSDGAQGIGFGYNTIYASGSDANQNLAFKSKGSGDLIFKTADTERMQISDFGNVGVKVSNPLNRLDVNASPSNRTGTHPANRPLYVTGDMQADDGVEFRNTNGAEGIGFGTNTIYSSGSNANQDLAFKSKGTGDLVFKTNANERMRVTDAGNVGIGTPTPNAPLQFANNVANRKMVLYEDADNDHEFYGLGVNASTLRYQVPSTGASHIFYSGLISASISDSIADSFSGRSTISSLELMRIQGDGSVGIGFTTPNERLEVGGNAIIHGNLAAENINVQGNANVQGNTSIEGQLGIGYEIVHISQVIPALTGEVMVACECPPGKRVLGGGYDGNELNVYGEEPTSDGGFWVVFVDNLNIIPETLYVYAICARVGN